MANVLVLAGGSSSEREVSLRSGAAVKSGLVAAGHHVVMYDPAAADDNLNVAVRGIDVAFPALHGSGGEDGTVQAQLERLHLPYVGSSVQASELCFDKWSYRSLMASYDLPIATGELVGQQTIMNSSLIKSPFVLKPPKGGSSVDTLLVRDSTKLPEAAINDIFGRHLQLLIEQLVEGVEITVGVLGEKALPVIEIIPPKDGEFDYENKYNGRTQELCPPKHVSKAVQKRAQDLAVKIHALCGCRDMSRTDMIVAADNSITVLETNTIPGLTDQSLLPKAAEVAGLTMAELCDKLVQLALSRRTVTS